MKKILLLIAIAAFTSANAQQVFKVDEHIQKMLQQRADLLSQKKSLTHSIPFSSNPVTSFTLPNGDKVVTFPSYNMPIIVPDMTQFQAMPNLAAASSDASQFYLFNQGQPGVIPNGALPLTAPTVSSLELLNQLLKKK